MRLSINLDLYLTKSNASKIGKEKINSKKCVFSKNLKVEKTLNTNKLLIIVNAEVNEGARKKIQAKFTNEFVRQMVCVYQFSSLFT